MPPHPAFPLPDSRWLLKSKAVFVDLHSDLPFWTVKNGIARVYPPLERDIRCDALVIGGGITGALVSRALVREGADCVVIDRRDIGQGSTSASTALLQYEIDTPLHKLIDQAGRQKAERAYRLGVEAVDELAVIAKGQCGFARRPSLLVTRRASDVPGLRREFEARKRAKLPVRWLERRELDGNYGIPRAAAIRSTAAAECDPYRLTHHLFHRCERQGLRIFDRTEAIHYQPHTTGVRVRTNRGVTIGARKIFFATGYETQSFVPRRIVKLASTYAFVSEPSNNGAWKDRALVWETGESYLYSRTTTDGRVLVGGEDDFVLNPARRDAQLALKTRKLLARFRTLLPGCAPEPAFCWAGTFGYTKDGLAYVGSLPSFPQAYFALGFGGNGITFSVTAARILTNLFLGRKDADAAIFRFDR